MSPRRSPSVPGPRSRPVAPVAGREPREVIPQPLIDTAARHVADSLARQDARTPRDAAIASLGPHATDAQITDWIARFRPEQVHRSTA